MLRLQVTGYKAGRATGREPVPRRALLPLSFPGLKGFTHLGFRVHAQSVRDAVNVIEIGDYLNPRPGCRGR